MMAWHGMVNSRLSVPCVCAGEVYEISAKTGSMTLVHEAHYSGQLWGLCVHPTGKSHHHGMDAPAPTQSRICVLFCSVLYKQTLTCSPPRETIRRSASGPSAAAASCARP